MFSSNPPFFRFLASTLIFASLFTFKLNAQTCTYLAYDAFDYPANQSLETLSGGSGWASSWEIQNNNTTVPGYQVNNGAGSMAYSNLQSLGRYARGGYQYLTLGRRLNSSDAGPFGAYVALNENTIGSQSGTTLWVSALLRKDQNDGEQVFVTLHDNNATWCQGCTGNKVGVGYFGTDSEVNGERRWSLRIGSAVYPTEVPVSLGVDAFLVLRLQFNAGNTGVDLFVNPATLGNTTPAPTLSQTSATPLRIRSLAVYLGNSPDDGAADELRFATSYACVAPDPTIMVNLPPTAAFSVTPKMGQAPLMVSVNAGASSDPESGALTYSWNFGDGTATQTGLTATHSYTTLGEIPVTLTVTDNLGLSSSTTDTVKVLDQYNTYPCQTSFSLLQAATCTGSNGWVRINNAPAAFALTSLPSNTPMPVSNENEFQNLPVGQYRFTAAGVGGCTDTFQLVIPRDSSTCANWQPLNCAMAIGTNMSGFADWVPERPLRNLFKHVRPQLVSYNDVCNCWDLNNIAEITIDANGYPTQIPQNTPTGGATNKVRFVISSEGGNLVLGQQYVLLYDGTGTLQMQGNLTVQSNTPGRIQMLILDAGNIFFNLTTSQAGDPVRNIRLLRLADELADITANPFYQGFLAKIAPFKVLRFMDWGATNGNPATTWGQRTPLTYFTYGTAQGVPYEVMIQLANQAEKDLWICVPHGADDNYLTQMATLFRDNLNPQRTVYLEYSNEVWNWLFTQAHYNDQNRPANLNYGRAMAQKAGHVFAIWHNVFGAQKNRVKRVLGMQAGYNWLNEQILSQLDPSEWDYGSPTWYFGLNHGATGNPVLTAASTAQQVVLNARNTWHGFLPTLRQDYNNIKLFGKKIINYEGGQHFTDFTTPPYLNAMYAAQYTQDIYQLYDEGLDTLRRWGSELPVNFSLAGKQESIYGSWGAVSDIDLLGPFGAPVAPKYQALLDNVPPVACAAILALEYTEMALDCRGDEGFLHWETASEHQIAAFDIEASEDGARWRSLGRVNPGLHHYRFRLTEPAAAFYRIRAEQLDGSAEYSAIRRGCPGKGASLLLVPNPSEGSFRLQSEAELGHVAVMDALGRLVYEASIEGTQVELTLSLPPGVYTVVADTDNRVLTAKMVVK